MTTTIQVYKTNIETSFIGEFIKTSNFFSIFHSNSEAEIIYPERDDSDLCFILYTQVY